MIDLIYLMPELLYALAHLNDTVGVLPLPHRREQAQVCSPRRHPPLRIHLIQSPVRFTREIALTRLRSALLNCSQHFDHSTPIFGGLNS